MDNKTIMTRAALAAMQFSLELNADDNVLVVTDKETGSCGEAFAAAAKEMGCATQIYWLPEQGRPLQQLPEGMLELLKDKTVVINAIIGDAREVPFRMEWIRAIDEDLNIRMGHSPGIDEDMMLLGPMNIDYGPMGERATTLMQALAEAESVHITTEAGTDLVMDITNRPFVSDLKATPEAGVNMPCGEIYCAPVEDGTNGTLVVDACFGSHGQVSAPVSFTVANGRVTDVTCQDQAIIDEITVLLETDKGARTIGELGIGLNPGARVTPRMLEAEKAHETAHIAFGSNEGMPGGCNVSQMHIDYLFHRPTIKASKGGDDRLILDKGKLVSA